MLLLSLLACSSDPPNVLFIVLDTVRADRTSLCGNARPTTPVLARQAARGSHTCGMKAPSTWTVPSHASFFTGAPLLEHHASLGHDTSRVSFGVRPMRDDLPTLAELFARDGYQTALVSANALVGPSTGLHRGFERVDNTRDKPQRGDAFVERVAENLATLDPDEPTFLFVNIVDAHDPWDAIPEGHPWLPALGPLDPTKVRRQARRQPKLLASPRNQQVFTDHYDYALSQADTTLKGVLDTLEAQQLLDDDWRMVITSDHGEFLGEHGRLLHNGSHLYEPVINVPLVYLDSDGSKPKLPPLAGGLGVFDLVRTGKWPQDVSIEAAHLTPSAIDNSDRGPCIDVSYGTWSDDGTKLACDEDGLRRFDLKRDPGEIRPLRLEKPASVPGLEQTLSGLQALNRTDAPGHDADEELRALGYVEDEDE